MREYVFFIFYKNKEKIIAKKKSYRGIIYFSGFTENNIV